MYRQCLNRLGDIEAGCALVAHHENDEDENCLAQLEKDNVVRINGMSNLSTLLGVVGSTLTLREEIGSCRLR